jgi:hypothetical protein
VDVNIVWGENPLKQEVGGTVDYVVASHVIEHVPDLIGWLREVYDVLAPGGTLGLVIPDRRFTFDLWRHESTLGEMVEAYLLRYRRPSIRQAFDAFSLSVAVDTSAAWQSDLRRGGLPLDIRDRLSKAFAVAKSLVATPRYVDVHCWVFTPAAFLYTAEALLRLDLFPFLIDNFFPTESGELEFQIRLIATAENQQDAIAESIAAARRNLANASTWPLVRSFAATAPTHPPDQPDIGQIQSEIAELRRALESMHRSMSWRITAPLRAAARRIGRGRS